MADLLRYDIPTAQNLSRIKRNIQKMSSIGASTDEIDEYVSTERVSPEHIKRFPLESQLPIQETDLALPEKQKTEALISKRPEAVGEFVKEWQAKPKGILPTILHPPLAGLKGLNILRQKGEAAIANPLMELQETVARPPFETAKRAGIGILKGLTGERRGELGDIPRRAGFGEPVSSFIGLGTSTAIVDPLVNKAITTTLSRAGKGIKDLITGERRNVLKASEDFVGGIDDFIDEAGKNVGQIFKGSVGQKSVDTNKLNQAINNLPEKALSAMKSKDAQKAFGIKFGENGQIAPTKENIWRLRRFLDDYITPKEFAEGATSATKGMIKRSADKLRGILAEGESPEFVNTMKSYSDFVNDWEFTKSVLTEKGRPIANRIITLFKRGGEPSKQDALRRIANLIPRGKEIINRAIEFNKSQTALKVAGTSLLLGGGLLAGKRIIARPLEAITGGATNR